MAERKKTSNSRAKDDVAEKKRKAEQAEAEQNEGSELDNPALPDQPDEMRHAAYFLSIVVGAFLLNLVILIVISGGR